MSSSDTSSGSSSDANTSATLPKGLSPRHTNVVPIASTPNRKRHRREISLSDRRHRKRRKRSNWMMSAIKQILLYLNEIKAELAALREEIRRLTASTSQPSAVEGPIVPRVSTMSGYDELTTAVSDATYRLRLVSYLSSIGGDTISAFAERLFFALFTEDVAGFLTFCGRKPASLEKRLWAASAHILKEDIVPTFKLLVRESYNQCPHLILCSPGERSPPDLFLHTLTVISGRDKRKNRPPTIAS
nr:unnamed protein product [Spirometra erinaceieuropaei]